jgi:hypothetical protein
MEEALDKNVEVPIGRHSRQKADHQALGKRIFPQGLLYCLEEME